MLPASVKRLSDKKEHCKGIMFKDSEYRELTRLVQKHFGIALGYEKRSMVTHRLQSWLVEQGHSSLKSFLDYLADDTTGSGLMALANRLTTNYSYFYRESDQLDFFFTRALPRKHEQSSGSTLNIWSAGCASGEEPYSIAMLMREYFDTHLSLLEMGILATDIDSQILKEAYKGLYREDRLSRLPDHLRSKYLLPKGSGYWEVSPYVKKMVHFTRYNLIRDLFTFKQPFFAIFCRNVMIYFDQQTINDLVERFASVLEPGGYLIIGQTESLDRNKLNLDYVAPSIYQKPCKKP